MFNIWQIQTLRQRLRAYKETQRKSWLAIAEAIIESPSNTLNYPEASEEDELELDKADQHRKSKRKPDVGWPIRQQDLSRFVDGETDKSTGERVQRDTSDWKLEAVFKFLVSQDYLPEDFLELTSENWALQTLISLSELIDLQAEPVNLSGTYARSIKAPEYSLAETCRLSSTESPVHQIRTTQVRNVQGLRRHTRKTNEIGWAIQTSATNMWIIVRSEEVVSNDERTIRTGLIQFSEKATENIGIVWTTGSNSQERAQITDSTPSINLLIYQDKSRVVCSDTDKPDSLEDERKKKRKPLSFAKRTAAGDRWKKFKNRGREKGRDMPDESTTEQFLKAAEYGEYNTLEQMLESGIDVNCEHPVTKARALHYVACYDAQPALESLERAENLEYLALDAKGRLPSYYAWHSAHNPVLGTYLQKKEIAEAEAKGVDYKDLLKLEMPSS